MDRLTGDQLRAHGACDGHLRAFEALFPSGMDLTTPAAIIEAMRRGINVWFVMALLSGAALSRLHFSARAVVTFPPPSEQLVAQQVASARASGLFTWHRDLHIAHLAMVESRKVGGKEEAERQLTQLVLELCQI